MPLPVMSSAQDLPGRQLFRAVRWQAFTRAPHGRSGRACARLLPGARVLRWRLQGLANPYAPVTSAVLRAVCFRSAFVFVVMPTSTLPCRIAWRQIRLKKDSLTVLTWAEFDRIAEARQGRRNLHVRHIIANFIIIQQFMKIMKRFPVFLLFLGQSRSPMLGKFMSPR